MANTDDQEVTAGFTWKYLALTTLIALLSAAFGFASNYLFKIVTKDTKEVLVS